MWHSIKVANEKKTQQIKYSFSFEFLVVKTQKLCYLHQLYSSVLTNNAACFNSVLVYF